MKDNSPFFHQDGLLFTVDATLKKYFVKLVHRQRAPKPFDIANNFDGTHNISVRSYDEANIVRNRLLGFRGRLIERRSRKKGGMP
jgi:hypothetical protein